jgi:hypothetical protein
LYLFWYRYHFYQENLRRKQLMTMLAPVILETEILLIQKKALKKSGKK